MIRGSPARTSLFRPGIQGQHMGIVPDEYVSARTRQCPGRVVRYHQQPHVGRR